MLQCLYCCVCVCLECKRMSGAMQETTPAAAAAMTCLSLPLQTPPLAASASQCAAAAGCLFAVNMPRMSQSLPAFSRQSLHFASCAVAAPHSGVSWLRWLRRGAETRMRLKLKLAWLAQRAGVRGESFGCCCVGCSHAGAL